MLNLENKLPSTEWLILMGIEWCEEILRTNNRDKILAYYCRPTSLG